MIDAPTNSQGMSLAASNQILEQRDKDAVDRIVKNNTARKKAEEVIYAHVSKWVRQEITVGEPIPLLRVEPGFGQLYSTILGGVDEVRKILDAAKAIDTSTLRAKVRKLEKLRSDIEGMIRTLSEADLEQMVKAEYAARNLHSDVEGRVVTALGAGNAARLGLHVIFVGLYEQVEQTKLEIENRGTSGPGRAKDEAAHLVALEAAKLYAKVTGKSPTYSEGPNGLSGQYTPFLRGLYDAFGWTTRSLRPGAEAAIKDLKPNDYDPPKIQGLMSFLTDLRR